jgi:hypothetical protein
MRPILRQFLRQSYQRDVMHTPVQITPMSADAGLIAEIKAELARIDAMRLGANLAQRAFVDYQNRRALVELLGKLETTATMKVVEARDAAAVTGTVPVPAPRTGALAVTEARDTANFHF